MFVNLTFVLSVSDHLMAQNVQAGQALKRRERKKRLLEVRKIRKELKDSKLYLFLDRRFKSLCSAGSREMVLHFHNGYFFRDVLVIFVNAISVYVSICISIIIINIIIMNTMKI